MKAAFDHAVAIRRVLEGVRLDEQREAAGRRGESPDGKRQRFTGEVRPVWAPLETDAPSLGQLVLDRLRLERDAADGDNESD